MLESSLKMKNYQEIIEIAAEIAREMHAGQVDKAGVDYFAGHLTHVALLGESWDEKVLGYLHDAAEDTPITENEVIGILQSRISVPMDDMTAEKLIDVLKLLNQNHSTSRDEYLSKILNNKLASRVKLNDLTNNMELTRIANPTEKDLQRIDKYKREIDLVRKNLLD